MPFLSERLWYLLFNKKEFLMMQKFLNFEEKNLFIESKKDIQLIINIITSVRNLRSELNIPYKQNIDLNIDNKNKQTNIFVEGFTNELTRLLKLNKISFDRINKKEKSAFILITDTTLTVPLEGVVDTVKELKKLNEKMRKENEKLNNIQSILENKKFMENAPDHVIEEYTLQANNIKYSIEKINQIINTIN